MARSMARSPKFPVCESFHGSIRRRRPASMTWELILKANCQRRSCWTLRGAVLGAGWQSGKFLYVDTDLKIDLPEARVVIDRERLADLGFDLARVGQELGTLLGGAYVNRFNFYDRSYKVIPQIGDKDRATLDPLLDLKIKTPEASWSWSRPSPASRPVPRPAR